MTDEFEQAAATAEMPAEEEQMSAEGSGQETDAGYDVDLDYNMEWEVETEPAEPDVIINDEYYDEAPRGAVRRINKHLFVWVFNFVCGMYGVDRFIRGQTALGVLKILTFGGMGMWYLADLIIALVNAYGGYNDSEDLYFDAFGRYV